ncbi:MAG: aspartyl protease family protein [Bauldia sp.]
MASARLTRRAILAGGGAFALGGTLHAAEGPGADLIIADYGLPFVAAELAGRAVVALIDSGGSRGVQVSETLARELGLSLSATAETTRRLDGSIRPVMAGTAESFTLAGSRFAPQTVAVAGDDIEAIAKQVGFAFDVILGWPFLGARPFAIDYPGRRFQSGALPAAGDLLLKLLAARAPVTEGTVAGTNARLLVDTGAPMCNLDASLAGGAAIGTIVTRPLVLAGRGLEAAFRVRDLAPIRQGLGATAVIGHNVLKAYRFSFDPSDGAIRLG